MLGVRRPSVTFARALLEKARLITYKRGRITILNREGLEAASCDCYSVVKREYERLLETGAGV
jgi:Mn-dependent DtxR family transcriptional regulator